jgi:hypothetical protein
MIPIAIEARVKDITALENTGRDAKAPTRVFENGTIDFFSTASTTSPFSRIRSIAYDQVSEATRSSEFSRSSRGQVEFIECTESRRFLPQENDDRLPRFRLETSPSANFSGFTGDFQYYPSYANASLHNRIYELSTVHSYDSPTISQLQAMSPRLTLRAQHDLSSWWKYKIPGLTKLDNYNEAYSSNKGLCLITRLHMYEPSSCHSTRFDSAPYYIHAVPVNADNVLSVEFTPLQHVWSEDETVPLGIKVVHNGSTDDSATWYFSHIEIEDLNYRSGYDKQNGGDFDLFSDGHTEGDSTGSFSDSVSIRPGIRRLPDGKTWRSFANNCTRWIYENGFQNGNSSMQGGFGAPGLDHTGFTSAANCLQHARQQGSSIWGQTVLRPYRKMTKNLHIKITVFMYEGDATGWHSVDPTLKLTATSRTRLVHVPSTTRYDQHEVDTMTSSVKENAEVSLHLSGHGVQPLDIPLPYRAGVSICTYVSVDTAWATNSFAKVQSHDSICSEQGLAPIGTDAKGGSICPSGKCYEIAGVADSGCLTQLGFRVTCKLTGADSTRATLESVIVFDETATAMPEAVQYQPAGANIRAHDDMQWYRLRACSANEVSSVLWCSGTTSAGYNTETSPATNSSGTCDISQIGAAFDNISHPSQTRSAIINNAENFWRVNRQDNLSIQFSNLCFQGRSDFNTNQSAPVKLRLIAVSMDSVTSHPEVSNASTWFARSSSDARQGEFDIHVGSTRQSVVPGDTIKSAWGGMQAIDQSTHWVKFVEERNSIRKEVALSSNYTYISSLPNVSSLVQDVDCGGGNSSDTICADTVRWTEQNNFHDQHIGRVEIKGYFQKTCEQSKMLIDEWLPAGGLFDVYVQYADDDSIPGNGFLLNNGAGYKVSDSHTVSCNASKKECTSEILSQQFSGSKNGFEVIPGQVGGSVCSIIYDSNLTSTASNNLRRTSCHIRDAYDVVGRDGKTWSDTVLHRVLINKCAPLANGLFDCPPGALSARVLASNLRFKLPEKWSNCVRFKFEVTVSNEDRGLPAYTFTDGTGADYSSPRAILYVQPLSVAEEPVMWIDASLSDLASCIGNPSTACLGQTGVKALGTETYQEISTNSLSMGTIQVIAGFKSQIRVIAGSASTDFEAESKTPLYPLTNSPTYAWDSMRSTYKVSGERVYLSVESKLRQTNNRLSNQNFCLWMCPESTPEGMGCDKSSLVRIRSLGNLNYSHSNVNCAPCTGGESEGCFESNTDANGNIQKCSDPYGRDPTLQGCPTYSNATATSYHNPGYRYSVACSKKGKCPEFRNFYISVM